MRLSELVGKEVINVYDGARLGVVGESDLLVDIETGQTSRLFCPPGADYLAFGWINKAW